MTNITERMKKYEELVGNKVFLNYCDGMLADLQAVINALEVAREALQVCKLSSDTWFTQNPNTRLVEEALQQINQILGEKK